MREEGEESGEVQNDGDGELGAIGGGCREEGEGSGEVQKDGEGELGGLERDRELVLNREEEGAEKGVAS